MTMISVVIVNKNKHVGELTNAGFVCGLTAGRLLPDETFGGPVTDGENQEHAFLTRIAHFVRKAGESKLRELRRKFADHPDVTLVDYAEAAAPSCYDTYAKNLGSQSGDQITYRMLYAYGPEGFLVPLTKNLSALG